MLPGFGWSKSYSVVISVKHCVVTTHPTIAYKEKLVWVGLYRVNHGETIQVSLLLAFILSLLENRHALPVTWLHVDMFLANHYSEVSNPALWVANLSVRNLLLFEDV